MKIFFAIMISVCAYSTVSAQTPAQPGKDVNIRICAPSRAGILAKPPLYVFFRDNKIVYQSDKIGVEGFNPTDIESINVLKNASAAEKYGDRSVNGVIEIHLKKGAKLDTNKLKTDTVKQNIRHR